VADRSRVARWRERLRQEGKKAITVWVSVEEEARLKDLALTWHCSPSDIIRQALSQFHPGQPPRLRNDTEETLIRIREGAAVTDSLPIRTLIQDILREQLPSLVREAIASQSVEAAHAHFYIGNDTDSVTETPVEPHPAPVLPEASSAEVSTERHTARQDRPQRPLGRPVGTMRQRIIALLAQHPAGLTAEQLRANLNAERPIGDTLQGMRRGGVVQVLGEDRQRRYVLTPQ